jgi:hypothetical protein
MRTVVQLGNSNCGWCLDAITRRLRAQTSVRRVRINATAGCLVVDHNYDDPTALIEDIRKNVRGWELAANGEVVMVDLDIHEEAQCRWAGVDNEPRPAPEGSAF